MVKFILPKNFKKNFEIEILGGTREGGVFSHAFLDLKKRITVVKIFLEIFFLLKKKSKTDYTSDPDIYLFL